MTNNAVTDRATNHTVFSIEENMKPATPLPWEVDDESTVCGNNAEVAYTRRRLPAELMDQDAAYIAHTANAYPRLVAALRRKIEIQVDRIAFGRWPKDDPEHDADVALLRSLAEIE